ncbi:PIG-L deacetylase family protein [Oxalobacteraceae bacterium A2-2]
MNAAAHGVPRDRRIVGAGTPDGEWQSWRGLRELPAVSIADLVPPGMRAVLVAPHPDDETLACGGLLQALAAQGNAILLAAVTDGAASHPGSPLWTPARLAEIRPQETASAMQVLDLPTLSTWRAGLPDGHVAPNASRLQDMLLHLLRPGDVVLSTWRHDGHPDHEAAGRAAAAAADRLSLRLIEYPVWAWHWSHPGDLRLPWGSARRLPLTHQQLRRKRQALDCYHSQLEPDASTGRPPVVPPTALARLLHRDEIYFL